MHAQRHPTSMHGSAIRQACTCGGLMATYCEETLNVHVQVLFGQELIGLRSKPAITRDNTPEHGMVFTAKECRSTSESLSSMTVSLLRSQDLNYRAALQQHCLLYRHAYKCQWR
eukprot:1019051-Pelagomonas_calceolata.AAC.5